ncbi:MAG: XRE family transcriptional regulator [Anaerolineae bacterium]|nr:XRE family transcriptional regulator [Anaerolineae bacterium]
MMPESVPNSREEKEALLHRKMLGVKIRHARIRAGLSLKEVGEALGVSSSLMSDIEFGRRDVSLPQLEVMAYLFNIPVIYFWSDEPIEEADREFPSLQAMALRQRIIGVLLRQARNEAGRSQEELAKVLGVPPSRISSYEFGKTEIPLPELEQLANYLNVSLNYFMDQGLAPQDTGGGAATLDEIAQFSQLPREVREFLLNPANLLYINISMRLSHVSADTLRDLAEGLLEVTY